MSKPGLTTAIIIILIGIACLVIPALSQAILTVDPSNHDFGEVDVGYPSSAVTVKVSTDAPCWISEVGLDGPQDFEITSTSPENPLGLFLPDESLSIDVTYTPSSSGKSFANLLIHYVSFGSGFRASAAESVPVELVGEGKADVIEIDIDIDIKPGSDPNSINLKSKGVVPVAALSSDDFDATTIDPGTVLFADATPVRSKEEDVDGDGDVDLLLHFKTRDLKLGAESTEATLTGATYDGQFVVEGTDTVRIVPKPKK